MMEHRWLPMGVADRLPRPHGLPMGVADLAFRATYKLPIFFQPTRDCDSVQIQR